MYKELRMIKIKCFDKIDLKEKRTSLQDEQNCVPVLDPLPHLVTPYPFDPVHALLHVSLAIHVSYISVFSANYKEFITKTIISCRSPKRKEVK